MAEVDALKKKLYGPPVDPLDQAAAEAQDTSGEGPYFAPEIPEGILRASSPQTPVDLGQPAMPTLAPQGPKNKFLNILSRVSGMTGEQPEPGKPYEGPTTGAEKRAALGSFLDRVGTSLKQFGTPGEQALAEKHAEFIPELAATTELKKAQLESLSGYREGQLANKEETNAINRMKAHNTMRLKGYVPDENTPGSFRPMTPDEILTDPQLSKNADLSSAAISLKQSQTALARARADALMNPNNAMLQMRMKEIESRMRMAQANMDLRQRALDRLEAVQGGRMLYDYGVNPITGETLTGENAAPFMSVDESGAPVPYKQATVFRPTTAARGRGEQAHTIVEAGEGLVNYIKQHADEIGPLASRYNDLLEFIGDPPPEFKQLAGEFESWIALHPAAHGFRGMNAVQQFEKAFGPIEMTPEALIAGIRGSYNTMGALQKTATPKTTGPRKPTATAGGGNENIVLYQFPDGTVREVRPDQVDKAKAANAVIYAPK